MFGFLIPKEFGFFDVFDEHAATCVEGASTLLDMLDHYGEAPAKVRRIKDIEHKADEITHHTMEMLHKTFVTPIDRDQIHELISLMDDVMDLIDGAARRMMLYGVKEIPPDLKELAKTLHHATLELQKAVRGLRNMKNSDEIIKSCIEINKLENDGDAIRDAAIAKLFKEEKNAVQVLVWKEIYGDVETAIDRCEDVANVIEGVVLENA
jgi:predicted phosphate transport protein (TIGR00153 family)